MRKVRLWLALVATLLATSAGAQSNLTVTAAEYFFDSDPGFGQATVINNVSGGELEIAIPTSNLSVGAHTLCIRTLASNGVWSTTMSKPIFVMSTGSEVARVEYFFDNDPGYGKGSVLATSGSPDVTIEISTADIAPGAHMLYLRSQDTNGNWSSVMAHPIYVFTVLPVAALEFFIDDNDPGEGKAISVPVATATAATAIFDIDTSELTPGEHTLNIRAMGIDSVWTAVSTRRFMVEGAAEPEPYAVLTENTSTDGTATPAPNRAATEKRYTLTFYYDDKKADRNGMSVGPFDDIEGQGVNSGWYPQRDFITNAVIDPSFANCTNIISTAYWFKDCVKLKSISGLEYLKTDYVTNMSSMFSGCSSLATLDVKGFKTDNVTNMSDMFSNCSSLTTLDVSGFKTDKVDDMSGMFLGCSSLTNIDVSGFKTDNVTIMLGMFGNCSSLTNLDVSNFNTANVTDMGVMFGYCSSLRGLDLSGFKTDNVVDMSWMFAGCSNLTSLNLSSFNTAKVRDMRGLFEDCSGLTSIDVSSFNTANVTDMSEMFNKCSSLASSDLSRFNTEKVEFFNGMFRACSNLTSLDLSGFTTSNVKTTEEMFQDCSRLVTIYVGGEWTTLTLNDSRDMFLNCTHIVGGAGTRYDAEHIDAAYAHIDEGLSNPGYFTRSGDSPYIDTTPEPYVVLSTNDTVIDEQDGNPIYGSTMTFYYDDQRSARQGMPMGEGGSSTWSNYAEGITTVVFDPSFANCTTITNTSNWFNGFGRLKDITGISNLKTDNVKNMSGMFWNCSVLPSLDLSSFNTSNVTNMRFMFINCWSLTSLDVSSFNTANVTDMGYMFASCPSLSSLDVSGFNTENVTNMDCMFDGCSLTTLDLSSFNTSQVTNMHSMFNYCTNLVTIFVGDGWNTEKVTSGTEMFTNCTNLVGGMGTTYDFNHIDAEYAHIDGGTSNPGYFTDKNATPTNFIAHITVNGEGEVSSGLITVRDTGEVEIEPGRPFQMFFYPDSAYYLGSLIVNGDDMTQGVLPATASGAASFTMQNVTSDLDIIVEFMTDSVVITDPEPYAVLSDNNTVLTFYYDEKKVERSGMDVGPFTESYENGIIVGVSSGWFNQRESITRAVFDESFAGCTTLTSTRLWFYGCRNLTAITGLQYLKTDNVTDMYSMFDGCSSLKSIDVSRFNTENVTQMWWMFNGCSSLTSLDLSNFNTANVRSMSAMFSGCSSLTSLDLSSFNTTKVTSMKWMFDGCQSLITLHLSNFNTANLAGTDMDDLFVNCGSLASIVAGNAAIPEGEYAKINNPNLLVYVNDASLAPSNITNVVINGFAKNIVLVDAKEGNNNFFAPEAFKAEMVNYTREFRQETTVGVSRGWESIALPFNVQTITHEKWGAIAPFNNNQSSKHFWLRQLGENGLFSATKIEANVPYVISMPNDAATYPEEFLLAGKVTFSAENVTIPATEPVILALADSTIKMVPTFLRVDRSPDVWAINVGVVRGQYYEGSVFEREYREVRPFESYTVHRGNSPAPRFVPINDIMNGTTGIENIETGNLDTERYYDLNGRKLQGKPKTKGVYITNGRKIVIK